MANVSKRYGKTQALREVSLEIRDGEFFVILGPSGAGKTTLLKVLAGVEDVDEGLVYFDDRIVNALEPHERNVAMTFESYALYPHLNVFDNMAFPLRSPRVRMSSQEIEKRVREVAKLLGIDGLLERRPQQLSNGQKQRVALGRSLVREPDLILLDEPLTHLDARLRHQMRAEFKQMSAVIKTTTIYVTHDYLEAIGLADRIALLNQGVVQQVGTPHEVFNWPANRFVAEAIGQPQVNILPGSWEARGEAAYFQAEGGSLGLSLPSPYRKSLERYGGKEILLGIRPQYLSLRPDAFPGAQKLSGTVYVFEPLGRRGVLTVTIGQHRLQLMTPHDLSVKPNEPIDIYVDAAKAFVFGTDGNSLLQQADFSDVRERPRQERSAVNG